MRAAGGYGTPISSLLERAKSEEILPTSGTKRKLIIHPFKTSSMPSVSRKMEAKVVPEKKYEKDMKYACDILFEMSNEQ